MLSVVVKYELNRLLFSFFGFFCAIIKMSKLTSYSLAGYV